MANFTFGEMFSLSWVELQKQWGQLGPTNQAAQTFIQDIAETNRIVLNDVGIIAAISVLYTVHRYLLTYLILQPFAVCLKLLKKDEQKFCESCCKFFYYSVFFAWEYYLVNILYPQLRQDPYSHWQGWHLSMEIPPLIQYLYYAQAGFYFHSIFATIFMDVWKKDSIAMIIHHILANTLIIFSMSNRYHSIGLVVMYLHDPADIFLEGSKVVVCLKNKTPSIVLEALSTIGFLLFTSIWFYLRLLVFPRLVLFSSMYVGFESTDRLFYFPFNIMLFMLYLLNVYWFHFIVALIFRIAVGTSKSVEDVREYDDANHDKKKN